MGATNRFYSRKMEDYHKRNNDIGVYDTGAHNQRL